MLLRLKDAPRILYSHSLMLPIKQLKSSFPSNGGQFKSPRLGDAHLLISALGTCISNYHSCRSGAPLTSQMQVTSLLIAATSLIISCNWQLDTCL